MIQKLKQIHQALGGLDANVIHIAGSKGKGTTAVLLAKIIELHGKKVGLFTSPMIMCVEEMIQINGAAIPRLTLKNLFDRIREIDSELSPFEEQTLAALLYFQENNCEFVVLECGLGGLNDATNIIAQKKLTLLTHIELEHSAELGNTLELITKNKLGICRNDVPLLTVPTQAVEVFETIKKEGYEALIAGAYDIGFHHPESAGLAVMAADLFGMSLDSVILDVLINTTLPGRFECIQIGKHLIILDGAHTEDSIQFFLEKLRAFIWEKNLPDPQFGIHFLKDKNPNLWQHFPLAHTVWVPIEDERAGFAPENMPEKSIGAILDWLLSEGEPQVFVLCGSFRLIAAFKRIFSNKTTRTIS